MGATGLEPVTPQLVDHARVAGGGLSPWKVKRILAALSCVFTFALRRGYITMHPSQLLERDERPHPLRSGQRVLTRTELARLFTPVRADTGRCLSPPPTRGCGSRKCWG
jgi:hypothetical protein